MPKRHIQVLRITEVLRRVPDSVQIHFYRPKVEGLQYKPGQFITLKITLDGHTHYRAYSLFTTQRLDDHLGIVVKRHHEGRISNYLVDYAREGMEVEALLPTGNFFLVNTVKDVRDIVLIGGGSGITPLFSILRSTLFDAPKSSVSLIYANKDKDYAIFFAEIEKLGKMFPARFQYVHVFSGNTRSQSSHILPKRLNSAVLNEVLDNFSLNEHAKYFLCGPQGIMEISRVVLEGRGVNKQHIHQENFAGTANQTSLSEDIQSRTVHVDIKGEQFALLVPGGNTILDAGLAKGLDMPYSCKAGTCATCIGRLKSGEVRMIDKQALSDWEMENGFRLACQALPLSDDVWFSFD